jgi:hypothetical protein
MAIAARAQVTTSVLDGRVADSEGNPLAGATIAAVHIPTGTTYGGASDATGNYRLQNMRPGGPYRVTFTYLGYATVEFNDINLVVADSRSLNARMDNDANIIDNIVVVANPYTTSGGGSVTGITTRDINLMPTISRSLTDMVRLTPQANGQSIGGGNTRSNYFTVDGGSFNNMFGIGASIPGGGTPISIDAIEQMSVSITPYDVRQSGFLGAAVNAVTRSGTNEFSGSAYTYFKNEKFDGIYVGDAEPLVRTPNRTNLLGARLGGPIIKNKLFFFANIEYEKNVEPGPSRRVSANGIADNDNDIARPTGPELDMISKYLMDTYGYDTGPYQGYSFDSPTLRILGRIDWNINRDHKFSVRYSRMTSKYNNPPSTSNSPLPNSIFSSGNRQSMSAMWYRNSGYFQEQNYTSLAAELNSSFLEGRVNTTLRFTYSDQDEPRSTGGREFPFVDIKKDGTAFTSFGTEVFSYGNLRKVKQFTISDDVNWSLGRHSLTAGVQYEHTNTKNGFMRMGTGLYIFDSWEDFTTGKNPSAYAVTYSTAEGYAQQFPSFNFNQYTLYAQDEIDLSDNFTLTAGIRFDLPTYPKMTELQTHPLIAAMTFEGVDRKGGVKYDTGAMPKARIMFSPRLGFNWDIRGDHSAILRGGTGLFTGRIPFVWIVSQSGDSGMLQLTQLYQGNDVPGPFNPDPKAYLPSTPPKAGSAVPTGGFTVMDPDFKMPQTWKSSLAVDVRLPWNMKGTIEGIYNRDINPLYVYKDGFTAPRAMNISGYNDNRMVYAYNYGDRYQNLLSSAGLPDPTGTYGANPLVVTNAPFKNGGYYASITAQIEKSFDHGFSGMIAYTRSWGKNLHDGGGDQMNSVWNGRSTVNGANSLEMGYAGYVVPNNVVASLSYDLFTNTTISLFYSGGNGGRFHYTYNDNLVNDGGGNNLIYIPRDPGEIDFVDYYYTPQGGERVLVWSAQEQEDAFFDYIEQDKYLSNHKGEYMVRGGAIRPWESRFDVKILQNFPVYLQNGKKNTIQVGIDIKNVANLLNKNWGGSQSTYQTSILDLTNASAVAGGARPTFTLVPLSGTSGTNSQMISRTFRPSVGFGQTYSFQLSLRYLFN